MTIISLRKGRQMKSTVCALIATGVFLFSQMLQAQVILPEKGQEAGLHESVFGLGLTAGPTTGIGLSFRHHLPSEFSYQIAGGIIKVDERTSYDIGVGAQYDLVRSSTNRFFVGGGFGHYYSGKSGHNDMSAPTRIGLGIGGEFAVTPGLHTAVELFFTYFSDGTVLPLPQLGLHYYFY